jgi:hypothetical protein
MLVAGEQAGGKGRARELIGEALATYLELGMTSWADKASELGQALGVDSASRS